MTEFLLIYKDRKAYVRLFTSNHLISKGLYWFRRGL